jgi:predicted 3-demethylubiquinone-9 3-methyltransferase (glyoxalase superfamily)
MQNKLIPSLWFSTKTENLTAILNYYKNIFQEALEAGKIMDLGETPSGKTELSQIKIFGQKYTLMHTEKFHAEFNDAFALTIECDDQAEIDKYWNYFTQAGKEVQCGWCIDKYGLRWQVIPKNLNELLSQPQGWQIMMKQKKIVIAEYLN